jgi:hypothetical protein
LRYPSSISQNIVIPKAEHLPTFSLKPVRTLLIVFIIGMLPAIHFNRDQM